MKVLDKQLIAYDIDPSKSPESLSTKPSPKRYLVEQDECCSMIFEAFDYYDLIVRIAQYHRDDSDLFMKAIKGLDEADDLIEMYNYFASSQIEAIYEINDILYVDKKYDYIVK